MHFFVSLQEVSKLAFSFYKPYILQLKIPHTSFILLLSWPHKQPSFIWNYDLVYNKSISMVTYLLIRANRKKVHSFLKQCLHHLFWHKKVTLSPNLSIVVSLKDLVKVSLFSARQRSCKHCLKSKWTLESISFSESNSFISNHRFFCYPFFQTGCGETLKKIVK